MKNIASIGNGGAILTNDDGFAVFSAQYINHGKEFGMFVPSGSNVRMSEVECAVTNLKLDHFYCWQRTRIEIAKFLISQT